MSAMLRANKLGGSVGKARRVRSLSLSDGSSGGSSDSEEAGARLSAASLDSPPRVHFSSITEEIGRMSFASSVASGSDDGNLSSPFQVGKKPSGDVFESSPAKTALKPGRDFTAPVTAPVMTPFDEDTTAKTPISGTEERRMMRSATTPNAMMMTTPGDRALRTSSSRHEMGGIDAQGIYPPSACVFVANLPESKDDRALEAAVTREFSKFGTVFVKIRREGRGNIVGMPYAFAQYTNDEDAKVAMEEGRGVMILGRPCRTEMVKANRTFIIYSRRGEEITTDIAREILEPYGELNKCEVLSAQMQEAMNLPTAVLVEFAKFDPKRDLNSAVRQQDGYRIDAFDVKKRNFISRTDADEEFLRKYDVDRRSVFVGGLPLDTQRQEVVDIFSRIGEVIGCNIVTRTNYQGHIARVFAFVEFARADMPDGAVEHLNDTYFKGNALKVERKVFKHIGTPRRVKSQAFSIRSSTTPKTPRSAAAAARSPMRLGAPFSGRREEMPPPAAQQGYNFPGAGHPGPFAAPPPLGFPAPSPAAPANGQPLVGASGLPVTPSTTPFSPNPFTYAGGYWPGMSIAQDPITGHTFWAYTPPVGATNAPTESPTRARASEHHYFRGA
ncbi:hypothetical protein C8A01DRAFT_15439 [Parachaetomium inaequale]|uniref:RRM domain-containing protein n=1 Tax=Parachaetomium inaequale TaxID=2588326 RepID=A0AAN6SST0_9PEZI|nr:hypothetical protein C8A01DRAFT_15439 [Parachaetomium inaequale]